MSEMIPHPIKAVKGKGKVKPDVIIVAGGFVGVMGYLFYKRRAANAAAAATVSDGTTDDMTNSTDDTSGYLDGDYSTLDYSGAGVGYGSSLSSYTDPATDTVISGTGTTTVLAPTTNAQWTQQATGYLEQVGYDGTTVLAALGTYLLGGTLNSTQYQIVQAAIGAEGYPPGGAPTPHMAPSTGQTTPAKPPATVTKAIGTPHISIHKNGTNAIITVTPLAGAKGYELYRNGSPVSHSAATQFVVGYNGKNTYTVVAISTSNIPSQPSNPVKG